MPRHHPPRCILLVVHNFLSTLVSKKKKKKKERVTCRTRMSQKMLVRNFTELCVFGLASCIEANVCCNYVAAMSIPITAKDWIHDSLSILLGTSR